VVEKAEPLTEIFTPNPTEFGLGVALILGIKAIYMFALLAPMI